MRHTVWGSMMPDETIDFWAVKYGSKLFYCARRVRRVRRMCIERMFGGKRITVDFGVAHSRFDVGVLRRDADHKPS